MSAVGSKPPARAEAIPWQAQAAGDDQGQAPRIAMISTHGYVAASPPLGAADTGGQVVFVLELSKKLAQLGYDVDIWTRRFEDQPEVELVADHVRILRVPCGGRDFIPKEFLSHQLGEWVRNAMEAIHEQGLRYQFINSHYWDAGVAGGMMSEALGLPHVHTPHSLGLWKQLQMERDYPGDAEKFEAQYNFAERIREESRLYAEASLVVATTPIQMDHLLHDYGLPSSKCRMIPPGYDDLRFFPVGEPTRVAIRQRLGFQGKVVLALGRLARNKGYDLLLDGFAVLAQREPDAVLHLAVGGTSATPLEDALLEDLKAKSRELGIEGKVIFGAFIPDEELPDYYRAADLFVLSSRYEPFGMTAIEAMASGTPVLVTVHGGLHRVLTYGRHALFADPFDQEDLGITMAKVFRLDRLRRRMGRMGAHKARSLFTWSGVAQQLLATVSGGPGLERLMEDTEWEEPWNDND
ncbi:MAG: glycosyltransferase [Holophagaceae bacterium]|nr:glycosyltransferase [Holophagaceae bacterium]